MGSFFAKKYTWGTLTFMKEIYLDHASATPLDPRVQEAMEPYLSHEFGNPSGLYQFSRTAKEAVEDARKKISEVLNLHSGQVIFTSNGTEAINLGLFGIARAYASQGKHIITTKIEHPAVLETCKALEKEGFSITYLDVDEQGEVGVATVRAALRPDTILVSVMYANNEVGTIQAIFEISKIVCEYRKEKGSKIPFLLTDACQAAGVLDLDFEKLGVDLMVFNGSKIYGPKGTGILAKRQGIRLEPIIFGGGQEFGLRSGTENVPGIVGIARALQLAQRGKKEENKRLIYLREFFIKELLERIPEAVLNGHPTKRLPNNVNISIPGIEGDSLVVFLDAKGIFVSTGSACSSTSLEPSHVISALGRSAHLAFGSIRVSFGRSTAKEDLEYALTVFSDVVKKLQKR